MKNLIFILLFCFVQVFAQKEQEQQQRANNSIPYIIAIHRLNNKTLNDSLLVEVEDTTNFFSRRTSVGQLKNYIGNNLPDTAFKGIDTLSQLAQTDQYLVLNSLGETKGVPVQMQQNSNRFYYTLSFLDSTFQGVYDSIPLIDALGDTCFLEFLQFERSDGNSLYEFNVKKQTGDPYFGTVDMTIPLSNYFEQTSRNEGFQSVLNYSVGGPTLLICRENNTLNETPSNGRIYLSGQLLIR